jgi:hypothetical protein
VVPGRVYIGTHGGGGKIYCFGTKDNNPPQVTSHYPANEATDVPLKPKLNVTFNEPVNTNTLTSSSFKLVDSGLNPVTGKITYDVLTRTAFFEPDVNLKRGEVYNVTITTGIQDYWSNALDGNKNGITDGSPVDDFQWNFTTSFNNPPMLTNPTVNPLTGDLTTVFEFKITYIDQDNDTPELNPSFIKVFIDDESVGRTMSLNTSAVLDLRDGKFDNGEEYIYTTTFSTYGQHKYKIVCFDGINSNETLVYNDPLILAKPVIDPISELNAIEDIDLILDLSDKIHDMDTSISELIININSSYATLDDLNITFNYPNEFNYPSGRSYEIVAINVSDSLHNISQDVKVNVLAVNDPPQITGVSDFQVNEDEYHYLDVTPYLSDVDNEVNELIVTENSNYATVIGKNITFYYPKDSGVTFDEVEIVVSDGENTSSQSITVTVIQEGLQFVLLTIPEQNATEDIDHVLELSDYILLFNGVSLEDLKVEINSEYCIITGTKLSFNYPNSFNYPSGRNFELVQVNLSDLKQIQTQEFRVNVQAINDGPELKVIEAPDLALSDELIHFEVEYLDIDGSEAPIVKLEIGNKEYEMNLTSGNIHVEGGIYKTELKLSPGDYEYHYSADDGASAANSVFKTNSYDLKILKQSDDGTDTDGDLIPDAWELKFGLNPNDPTDSSKDPDGDNFTNLEEFLGADGIAGGDDSTDPKNELDFPVLEQDGTDDEPDNGKADEETSDNYFNLMALAIIIIVVVILLLVSLLLKRGKKNEEEDFEEQRQPSDVSEPSEESMEDTAEEPTEEAPEEASVEPRDEADIESVEDPSVEPQDEPAGESSEEPQMESPDEPVEENVLEEPKGTVEEPGEPGIEEEGDIENKIE